MRAEVVGCINILNIHLTTLTGERVGKIRLNRLASSLRLQQLDLILNHVISAYQESTRYRIPPSSKIRKEDIWIIGGDFNATPDSEELSLIKRMGFIDAHPDKKLIDATPSGSHHNQIGTKWSLSKANLPPTVLDYILCGLERTTFPIGQLDTANSRRPYRPRFTNPEFQSDHAVLFASFKL